MFYGVILINLNIINFSGRIKGKGKVVLVQGITVYRARSGRAAVILEFDTTWRRI
jgi:hypothetical protein